jgi:hypothetical protein
MNAHQIELGLKKEMNGLIEENADWVKLSESEAQ